MDMDIILIDCKIHQYFQEEVERLEIYKSRLLELEDLVANNEMGVSVEKTIRDEIQTCRDRIKDITEMTDYNFYVLESFPIIDRYKIILRTPVKISFFSTGDTSPNKEKESIIAEYIQIAKRYIKNIDVDLDFAQKVRKVLCENCTSKRVVATDGVSLLCQECGYEKDLNGNSVSYKDISRITILQKYMYERKSHFRDCINQYQGKQICKLDDDIFPKLDIEFEKHHMLVGDKNTIRETRYQNVKLEHVVMFLKELGYDKQHENSKYIHSVITGKNYPDLSHVEDQLMTDFDVLVNAYVKKYKYENKISRKSFMNIQYVLFQLLNKNKVPYRKEDFNILKTNDRKTFHDDIAKSLFEDLGWNHTALF